MGETGAFVNKRQVLENFYLARKRVAEFNDAIELLREEEMDAAAAFLQHGLNREAAELDELVDSMEITIRKRQDDA